MKLRIACAFAPLTKWMIYLTVQNKMKLTSASDKIKNGLR